QGRHDEAEQGRLGFGGRQVIDRGGAQEVVRVAFVAGADRDQTRLSGGGGVPGRGGGPPPFFVGGGGAEHAPRRLYGHAFVGLGGAWGAPGFWSENEVLGWGCPPACVLEEVVVNDSICSVAIAEPAATRPNARARARASPSRVNLLKRPPSVIVAHPARRGAGDAGDGVCGPSRSGRG